MTFGERLSALMVERGVSQYRLSKDIGVSNSTIANWRGDLVRPEGDKLIKLAEYFNVPIDFVLGKTDDSYPKEKSPVTNDEAMALATRITQLRGDDRKRVEDYLHLLESRQGT